ncbi:MAG: hypothetical protein ACO2PM_13830, partial [Pyrobaculum sp.]
RDVYDPHGNFVLADMLYHYGPRGVLLRQIELDEVNVRREARSSCLTTPSTSGGNTQPTSC